MRKLGFRSLTRVAALSAPLLCTQIAGSLVRQLAGQIGARAASALIASLIVGLSASSFAQTDSELDRPLVNEELSNELSAGQKPSDTVEAPPPAEYPYPGAAEDGYKAATPPAKELKSNTGDSNDPILKEANEPSAPASRRPSDTGAVRPKAISEDGTYVYSTELKKTDAHPAPGVEAPTKTDELGQYFYKEIPPGDKTKTNTQAGAEKPVTISSKGEYVYKVKRTKATTSASVRLGMMTPPKILNSASSDIKFSDIYGNSSIPVVFGDYEWRLTSKVGRLGIKFTTGIATSSGSGRFAQWKPGIVGRPSPNALEKFTFINFPNQGTLIYKFQYADNQVIVPYVEGGGGYFTFAELRNDNKNPKFGGSPVGVVAAGGSILLDWIDKRAIHQLDAEYGVSHVWLTAEFRQILGLNKNLDFTSTTYNVGFMMEF